jgi:hypothetical protein
MRPDPPLRLKFGRGHNQVWVLIAQDTNLTNPPPGDWKYKFEGPGESWVGPFSEYEQCLEAAWTVWRRQRTAAL